MGESWKSGYDAEVRVDGTRSVSGVTLCHSQDVSPFFCCVEHPRSDFWVLHYPFAKMCEDVYIAGSAPKGEPANLVD